MAKRKKATRKPKDVTPRFGIGEWFGNRLNELTSSIKRQYFGAEQLKKKRERELNRAHSNPAREMQSARSQAESVHCGCTRISNTKERAGRLLKLSQAHRANSVPPAPIVSTKTWTSSDGSAAQLLGDDNPRLVGEVGFLEAGATTDNEGGDDVGRFDMILVSNKTAPGAPMEWCAVEIQAVYFSGDAMLGEFTAYADTNVDWMIFPAGRRRPDYRSSGPKRLMPQLQIKIPTLRRWGKKMAVVVDRAFFDSIGEMDRVTDISNADIAWFIVRFDEHPGEKHSRMVLDEVRLTTLERSVEGLTGG